MQRPEAVPSRPRCTPHKTRLWTAGIVLSLVPMLVWAIETGPEDTAVSESQLARKLNAYVECINFHGNWTLQSRDRYFSWLKSPDKGPTGREDVVYGLYELRDAADCREDIRTAAGQPPEDQALEAAASDFVSALDALTPLVGKAHRYYELGDWQDDDMRAGKAMHAGLVTAFATFTDADHRLRKEIDRVQDASTARRLAKLKADPAAQAAYVVELLLHTAKSMVDRSTGMGGKGFQRESFAAAVADYGAAYDAYDSFKTANPKHPDEAISSAMVAHTSFDLLKSAKSAARRERQGFKFDDGEQMLIEANAAQMVDGHPSHLIDKYNQFITHMNVARR